MIFLFLNLLSTAVIILGLWFLFNFLAKKFKLFENKINLRRLVVTLTTVLFYALFFWGLIYYMLLPEKEDFDSTKWLTEQGVRDNMLDDLIDKELLEGINKSQVKSILGEPDKTDSLAGKWIYETVGMSGLEMVIISLEISFQNEGVYLVEKIVRE